MKVERLFKVGFLGACAVFFVGCSAPAPTPLPPPIPEKITPQAVKRYKTAKVDKDQLQAMRVEAEKIFVSAVKEIDEVEEKSGENLDPPARFDAVVADYRKKNGKGREEL
jgi:hypothetical protein